MIDMMENQLDPEIQKDLRELAKWCSFLDERVRTAGWWVEMFPAVTIIHEITERLLAAGIPMTSRMPIDPERMEELIREMRDNLEGGDGDSANPEVRPPL